MKLWDLARVLVAIGAGTFVARESYRAPALPSAPRLNAAITGIGAAFAVWTMTAPKRYVTVTKA